MESGRLRTKVTVQREKTSAEGASGSGGHVDSTVDSNWTEYIQRYAEIRETGGREFEQGGQVFADISHLITMRFDTQVALITTKHRLTWTDNVTGQARTANIENLTAVAPSGGSRRAMQLVCKEVV